MHFDYPFSFSSLTKHATEVEQDSIDDVINCVEVAILTDYGSRPEVPGYGLPDQVFDTLPLNLDDIATTVEGLEPRASLLLTQEIDPDDNLIARITAAVSIRSVGA